MGLFKSDKPPQLGEKYVSMGAPNTPSHQGGEVSMAPPEPDIPDDHEYPTGVRLAAIIASIFIAMFLVALVHSKSQNPLYL